jgi:hypothetical protein
VFLAQYAKSPFITEIHFISKQLSVMPNSIEVIFYPDVKRHLQIFHLNKGKRLAASAV